jgi:putative transposase
VKYAWITKYRDSFPISVMCDVLNVSPSGYYDSIERPPSERAKRHERIRQAVEHVHAESNGIYGSYKVAEVLQKRDDLESACRKHGSFCDARNGPEKPDLQAV